MGYVSVHAGCRKSATKLVMPDNSTFKQEFSQNPANQQIRKKREESSPNKQKNSLAVGRVKPLLFCLRTGAVSRWL